MGFDADEARVGLREHRVGKPFVHVEPGAVQRAGGASAAAVVHVPNAAFTWKKS